MQRGPNSLNPNSTTFQMQNSQFSNGPQPQPQTLHGDFHYQNQYQTKNNRINKNMPFVQHGIDDDGQEKWKQPDFGEWLRDNGIKGWEKGMKEREDRLKRNNGQRDRQGDREMRQNRMNQINNRYLPHRTRAQINNIPPQPQSQLLPSNYIRPIIPPQIASNSSITHPVVRPNQELIRPQNRTEPKREAQNGDPSNSKQSQLRHDTEQILAHQFGNISMIQTKNQSQGQGYKQMQ